MQWLSNFLNRNPPEKTSQVRSLQKKFNHFITLLDYNNRVLKTISDMEEKLQDEFLFDMNYIHSSLDGLLDGVSKIIDNLIELGGEKYASLIDRFDVISNEISQILPGSRSIAPDDLTIPLRGLRHNRAWSVGSKNANLGEIKVKLNMPVPGGFAISAWGYKMFLDANNLQKRITSLIESLNIGHLDDLNSVSEEIQAMVLSSPVPDELAQAIRDCSADIEECKGIENFSMRSSAIGEDTQFSFAGQYATYLNVRRDELIDAYRSVIASKFTPKAIYYFLSHALSESELAMSVGCVEMINAAASGVVYTQNPVDPNDDCLVISSIFGLGRYLVDGILTPDMVRVSRKTREIIEISTAFKPVRLILGPESGTVEAPVHESRQETLSIGAKNLTLLTKYSMEIEKYYGAPQDIEWVIDRDNNLKILQTRPLKVIETRSIRHLPDRSAYEIIISGGQTVCPGAGGGRVFHINSPEDLAKVPRDVVLVAQHSFPGLVTVMEHVNALVVEVGGVASHMATLAREYGLPTLAGIPAVKLLQNGQKVTIDATDKIIYDGIKDDLIEARRNRDSLFADMVVMQVMRRLLSKISPLNLVISSSPNFKAANCNTLHDITRFAHQKSMTEMFNVASDIDPREPVNLRLKSKIPLNVRILFIDDDKHTIKKRRWINDNNIPSQPLQAFWDGVKQEGWPSNNPPGNSQGFTAVRTTQLSRSKEQKFEESSYAVLSHDYMVLSLRLGYHFTSIEAMCTDEISKNYIRLQHKGGGAKLERRVLRVKLISKILSALGFKNLSKADFLDGLLTYQSKKQILDKLHKLGQMTMRTKQLDMALTNESITEWYARDIMDHLDISHDG